MTPNYNSTAFFYDRLSRILFGNALIEAQVFMLSFIKPGSSILIVGGGTGLILEEISKLYPSGLNITYVEMAEKMMSRARKRFTATNELDFINDDVKNLSKAILYDAAITPFFFDNFSQQNAERLFEHIQSFVKPGGVWLYCDFQLTGKWWQKMLLKLMLVFFRVMCSMEATKLPDMKDLFIARNYIPVANKTFFSNFVLSTVYKLSQQPCSQID